jgi:hypothetical protein
VLLIALLGLPLGGTDGYLLGKSSAPDFPYVADDVLERAKIDAAQAQMKVIANACDEYRLNHTEPPKDLKVLLQPDPAQGGAPYLRKESDIIDPWGHPYGYEYKDAEGPIIRCKTADGKVIKYPR